MDARTRGAAPAAGHSLKNLDERQSRRGGNRRVHEVESVVVEDAWSFEKGPQQTLCERSDRGADDDGRERRQGDETEGHAERSERECPEQAGGGSFSRNRARRTRRNPCERRDENRARPPCFSDLAGDRVA